MKKEFQNKDGDLCIEIHDTKNGVKCSIGKFLKGLFEWMGKDFKFHRYQGMRVLFDCKIAREMVKRLSAKKNKESQDEH